MAQEEVTVLVVFIHLDLKGLRLHAPFELTVLDSDSCWANKAFTRNLPNCKSAFIPNKAAPPLIKELLVFMLTLPASNDLIISSSRLYTPISIFWNRNQKRSRYCNSFRNSPCYPPRLVHSTAHSRQNWRKYVYGNAPEEKDHYSYSSSIPSWSRPNLVFLHVLHRGRNTFRRTDIKLHIG